MERYLITGGAGFIGSNIVDALLCRDCQVVVLDNFSTGKIENIERVIRSHSLIPDKDYIFVKYSDTLKSSSKDVILKIIEGDFRDIETCRMAVSGASYVLHQGALPSVPRSIADPATTNEVNVKGTLNMLIAARDENVKRFVFASSSSVYGDTPALPKVETMNPSPLSPYALSKLTGELYSRLFHKLYGLSTVSLRYFNVFGPAQDPASQYAAVIPRFITALINGKPPVIYGGGEQSRDFTFVEDCVEANMLACKADGVSGDVFNIACGKRTTINDLFNKIGNIIGSPVRPEYAAARPGDVRHSLADINKAREALRYSPEYDIKDGLKKTVDWFRSAHKTTRIPGGL